MPSNRTETSSYNLPHIRIEQFRRDNIYSPPPRRIEEGAPRRSNVTHGADLSTQFSTAYARARRAVAQRRLAGPTRPTGVYLEVASAPGESLGDLTWEQKGIRLGALRLENETERAAVFVPNLAEAFVAERLSRYASPVEVGRKASLQDKFSSLVTINAASLRSLWSDSRSFPEDPQQKLWWECWVWTEQVAAFQRAAVSGDLLISTRRLIFPEVETIPVYGNTQEITDLIFASGAVERVRNATDNPSFFTITVRRDQDVWVNNLRDRITGAGAGSPAVCLLDSGVARAHPLLDVALSVEDCMAVNPAWGTADDHGHGTQMAGTILYDDLTFPLADQRQVDLVFKLESVKLLPPLGFPETDPNNYGSITQSAVSTAEIKAPHRRRLFCMAVTNNDISGEEPTSWSAALDQAASGAMIGDRQDANTVGPRRLFFVSAGNIPDSSDPDQISDIDEYPVEDPAQAWNVVTVGGYTEKTEIDPADGYANWTAVAEAGDLSPYSRISTDWEHSKTPIKPEIVFEAGNKALSPEQNEMLSGLDSLSLLTTNSDFTNQVLTTFWATSAATAQAAGMAGILASTFPHLWDETIRALIIHSADWTPAMLKKLEAATTKKQKIVLARHFGYGVPSLGRALASAENDLVLLAQRELAPFHRIRETDADGRSTLKSPSFKQIDYYDLPWPTKSLEALGEKEVALKVTLSYFVEPSPTWDAARAPQQYQSFGLRFDLKRSSETEPQFHDRVNNLERDGQPRQAAAQDDGWTFGNQSIAAGSLHCDIWRGTAAKLAARGKLAVYPVGGWWRDRVKLGRHSSMSRYALTVSISSEELDVQLYTEIANLISISV